LEDFTAKLVRDIVESPNPISFLAHCSLLHFTILIILSDPHAEVSFASTVCPRVADNKEWIDRHLDSYANGVNHHYRNWSVTCQLKDADCVQRRFT